MNAPEEPTESGAWPFLGLTRAKVEPTADQRGFAKGVVGMFQALMDEGMTDRQACLFLGTWFGNTPPETGGDT